MRNPPRRRTHLGYSVPVLIGVAVLVAACSSGSGTSAGATSGSAATPGGSSAGGGSSSAAASSGSGTAAAAETAAATAACNAASNEDGGKLIFWAATDPDAFQKEIAPFEKEHPNIKISYTSLRPPDYVQRLIEVAQAHHAPTVDAVVGDLSSLSPAFQQGLFQNINWTQLGVPAERQITFDGIDVWRVYRDPQGIVYNTQRVQASDLPKTWKELVNSKYAGQVIVDPSADYVDNIALAYGPDEALTWFKSLLSTVKPVLLEGATASVTKVVSGENAITTSATYSAYEAQKVTGAPIQIAYLDYVPTFDYYAQVLKGAAHPDAAKCFLSWYSGSEAAAQLLKYEYKQTASTPANLPAGSKVVSITTPAQAATITRIQAEMGKLMQQ